MACNYPYILIRSEPCFHMLPVPCCKCQACRKDRLTMWQDRISFESLTSPLGSSFLTLTYDDDHIPADRSANLKDVQNFIKRLRKRYDNHLRYFMASEYGDEKYRIHYHFCLTNFEASEENQIKVFQSWQDKNNNPIGIFTLTPLTPARIRYCVEYISLENPKLYKVYEAIGLKKPIHTMSKGIGKEWILAHADMIKESNGYYSSGVLRPIPRYFADKLGMIETNAYVNNLNDIWQKYNERLALKGIEPVNPFDVLGAKKRGLLNQASSENKRTVLQLFIADEGKELYLAGKNAFNFNKVS